MKFKIQDPAAKHNRVFAHVGTPDKVVYAGVYDEKGNFDVVEKGKMNLYNEIQAERDSVDIYAMLARFSNGDQQALNKVQGVYGDVTKMPRTYAEMLQTLYNAENTFAGLPVELKAKFGNDVNRFIASMDTPEQTIIFNEYFESVKSKEKAFAHKSNITQSSNVHESGPNKSTSVNVTQQPEGIAAE